MWQKKRLEILSRDKWTCCKCGSTESQLHVHHKTYDYGNDPWDYEDDNFTTLCSKCHSEVEYDKALFNAMVKYLLRNNETYYDLFGDLIQRYNRAKANVQKGQKNG